MNISVKRNSHLNISISGPKKGVLVGDMVIEWQVEYVQVANIGPVAEIKNIIYSFTAQMETVYLSYVLFSC